MNGWLILSWAIALVVFVLLRARAGYARELSSITRAPKMRQRSGP